MPTISESIIINAPVDRVFRFVTNPENWTRYVESLSEVSNLSSPRMEPGTTFAWEYRAAGATRHGSGHVNQNVPNAKFSMSMDGGVELTETYTFTPREEGTELTVQIGYGGEEPPLEASPGGTEDEEAGRILETIKKLCEQTAPPLLH